MTPAKYTSQTTLSTLFFDKLNGSQHGYALLIYMIIVIAHLFEHLTQVAQVFVFGWARGDAGGLLGLHFTGVAENELLHIAYNSFQLTGLIVLAYGFRRYKAAFRLWLVALALQSWHWLEHAFLIFQLATGHYFYGAIKQMSVLERFVPRTELHFLYNLAVFVPTIIALYLYARAHRREAL